MLNRSFIENRSILREKFNFVYNRSNTIALRIDEGIILRYALRHESRECRAIHRV